MYQQKTPAPFRSWRLTAFQVTTVLMFMLFAYRTYKYQFVERAFWLNLAEENRISQQPIAADRGVIEDRYGLTLARNVPAFNVTIVPAYLPAPEEREIAALERLGMLLDIPATDDAARAAGREDERSLYSMVREGEGIAPYRPVTVAHDIDRDIAMRILEESLTLPGVDVPYAAVREYPTGALTAQIVGYMVPIPAERQIELMEMGYDPAYDRIGLAGIEGYLEDELAGRKGVRVIEVDVAGLPVNVLEERYPIAGRNVRLTIDTELQQAAQEALIRRIKINNDNPNTPQSNAGVVIAMNPNTGEVLAMVSWPTFDNSRFARAIDANYYFSKLNDPLLPLVNHVTGALYPPGSVWKVLVTNGVLQEDVIHPEAILECKGKLILPNRYAPNDIARAQTFVCWLKSGHGEVNTRGAIAHSCDVYFYQVGGGNPEVSPDILKPGGLGINNLVRYAHAFGVGTPLGIELPGELSGRMPDRDWKRRIYGENWSTGDTYNAAFGQGYVTVTPLQLINAVASIVNGGTLYRPTVIREYFDAEGQMLEGFQPQVLRTIVRPTDGSLPVITPYEDLLIRGADSLVCQCNPSSDTYDAARCTHLLENGYQWQYELDTNPDPDIEEFETITYTVNTDDPRYIAESICIPERQKTDYQPPFVDAENMQIVREGMRQVVTHGTGKTAALPYVAVAGKTGTAEYCDDIARNQGLCKPGEWPAHAWYTGYAPYDDPEIIILAFLYNGGEGSAVALPVVREVMDAYFNLKVERLNPTPATPEDVETPPAESNTP